MAVDTESRDTAAPSLAPMRVTLLYDMDACRGPTGVTRHAMAQVQRLAKRPDVKLTLFTGRLRTDEGRAFWDQWAHLRRCQAPLPARDLLRLWRVVGEPAVEWWTGKQDWIYCPAEYYMPARRSRRAVTSHDILQDLQYGSPRRQAMLRRIFLEADLILSVSQFNTQKLLEAIPACEGRVELVYNGAEDLFYEQANVREVATARTEISLPEEMPYLLSVANFQTRKNLPRLLEAAAKLPEVADGSMAVVLVGSGSEEETHRIIETARGLGPRVVVARPGYRQGKALRALYAGASALVFPSLCESFGIPAVEAMAQGCPVALANSTALPEIGGDAGWYFDPQDEDSIAETLRSLLDHAAERNRRVAIGREQARRFTWDAANFMLMEALRKAMR